ncbi:hypothetical protein [Pseudoduganella chitinolytica]|uniref:Uncharacterized protein n=1 Tax=Pseudoduganella chitinolytica TaxID=34070 RepID=A0ABY8BBU9_9BURK|nr:hypothetical protein [Pseudoduganella chitinolytica]WEF33380.1 hypothetical protein PX653_00880 [Pseudoduganella chitinolytica]
MAIDHTDPIYLAPAAGGAQPELMLSAVLHLMSHYTASEGSACVKLAAVIERHLKALSSLPGMAPVLAATCQQLSEQWAGIVERSLPPVQAKEEGFLSRIMGRGRTAPQVA